MHAQAVTKSTGFHPCPTVLRWKALIDKYGSETAALEALIRQADELDRLKGAVRAQGLSPESLLRG